MWAVYRGEELSEKILYGKAYEVYEVDGLGGLVWIVDESGVLQAYDALDFEMTEEAKTARKTNRATAYVADVGKRDVELLLMDRLISRSDFLLFLVGHGGGAEGTLAIISYASLQRTAAGPSQYINMLLETEQGRIRFLISAWIRDEKSIEANALMEEGLRGKRTGEYDSFVLMLIATEECLASVAARGYQSHVSVEDLVSFFERDFFAEAILEQVLACEDYPETGEGEELGESSIELSYFCSKLSAYLRNVEVGLGTPAIEMSTRTGEAYATFKTDTPQTKLRWNITTGSVDIVLAGQAASWQAIEERNRVLLAGRYQLLAMGKSLLVRKEVARIDAERGIEEQFGSIEEIMDVLIEMEMLVRELVL